MAIQAQPATRAAQGGATRRPVMLWSLYALLIVSAVAAGWWGLKLRRDLYTWSNPIRFTGDITNAWNWGTAASSGGVVSLYDRLEREVRAGERDDYGLDYPPVRAWLVMQWVRWTQRHFPNATGWQRDYEFSAPMLWGNNIAEVLSALAVFLIVRKQVLRGRVDAVAIPTPGIRAKAVAAGFVGAMLFWFNLGVLFDAHCFPQWDMWIMPMFLFAVFAGMHGRFFTAGLLLGAGMLIKGQILFAAPVLLLWPLFAGNWRGVLSLLLGVVAAVAALTWLWLVRGMTAHLFVIGIGLLTLLAVVHWRRWRWLHLPIGMMGLAAIACGFYGGSFSWLNVAFTRGALKYPFMYTGGTSNLCTLLHTRFMFSSPNEPITLPWGITITLRMLLGIITGTCVLMCGWGAARHFRRRDPRFLVAVAAPFVLFYTLMPQMHDRYLVWGAAATALLAGVGLGMVLVHLAITFIMWAAVGMNLYGQGPAFAPQTLQFLQTVHGGLAYALLVLAGVLLCQAWPSRGRALTPPLAASRSGARGLLGDSSPGLIR